MAREPIPTWCYALIVVRLGHRFLVVREAKHGQLWYLPAGRIEHGERFEEGALREVFEEAGLKVKLRGLLKVQFTPIPYGARCRMVFLAEPVDDTPPKQLADDESLEARWVSLEELSALPLRGQEVIQWFELAADPNTPIIPLSFLGQEGESR